MSPMYNRYCRFLFFLSTIVFCTAACTGPKKAHNSGIVVYRGSFYVADLHGYLHDENYYTDRKIWYRDSSVIEQLTGISSIDSIGFAYKGSHNEKKWIDTMAYIFRQLPTRSFYEYHTLTDTAKLVKEYTQPDSVFVVGGWNFYAMRNNMSTTIEPLADTIMEGIAYKRSMLTFTYFDTSSEKTPYMYIGYFRCDKKGTMFQLEKRVSEKMGCPMVRSDGIPNNKNPHPFQLSVEYVTDKLTPAENRMFDTWEKYARKHPVAK